MKAFIQRVATAGVTIDGKTTARIEHGYLILLGVAPTDSVQDAAHLAYKTTHLRIFPDDQDRMNLSIIDTNGQILVVSQFTLYADTSKGHRPSFTHAAPPPLAESLYTEYVKLLGDEIGHEKIATGTFGAMMSIDLTNDGPVTIELTSENR